MAHRFEALLGDIIGYLPLAVSSRLFRSLASEHYVEGWDWTEEVEAFFLSVAERHNWRDEGIVWKRGNFQATRSKKEILAQPHASVIHFLAHLLQVTRNSDQHKAAYVDILKAEATREGLKPAFLPHEQGELTRSDFEAMWNATTSDAMAVKALTYS